MAIIVQKFGGTSLADSDKIKNVAKAVVREKKLGNDVIVVVSAMGHTTDNLIKLAHEISDHPSEREMDMLMSTGEQISISLLAIAIHELGYKAVSMTGAQVGIYTEDTHSKARIIDIKTDKLTEHLKNDEIVIVAGFQGITKSGEITTLGRGGSDTSAVAIAAKLRVENLGIERCDIYSDVEGIYTTDPRVVPTAKKLDVISYEEMLELARVGANVLHPRSVETAKQFQVPMRLRSSFKLDDLGTLIIGVEKMEINKPVTGVAADLSQVRIVVCDVPDKPGVAAKLFSRLAKENISVDMIIQSYARKISNTNDIAFTVDSADLLKTREALDALKRELGVDGNIQIDENIAKVSIVGAGMIDRPGVASAMFETLAQQNINIRMISTSEIKISCLVDKENARHAVQALHKVFGLESSEIAEVKGDLPNLD